jgi:NAD(P)-dependent dehydrogenase (short-subunit alcohol dehydrogenase family)
MSKQRFSGKVALVTGGASGIGLCTVRIFAREGASIALCDRNVKDGEAVVAELRQLGAEAIFFEADLAHPEQVAPVVQRALERFGRIDILVNNAGGGQPGGTIESQDEADWDWTFNVNLKSAWQFMKHVFPAMVKQGGGAVVNIASLAGIRVAPNSSPAYSAAKASLVHLSEFAAVQYGPHGIRVNVVAPGLTATPAVMNALTEDERTAISSQLHPIPRMANPEETAATIAWLCCDEAPIISGITVPVDGGWSAR